VGRAKSSHNHSRDTGRYFTLSVLLDPLDIVGRHIVSAILALKRYLPVLGTAILAVYRV
jgi:hypothetical protein